MAMFPQFAGPGGGAAATGGSSVSLDGLATDYTSHYQDSLSTFADNIYRSQSNRVVLHKYKKWNTSWASPGTMVFSGLGIGKTTLYYIL